jgi:hypothetical protein
MFRPVFIDENEWDLIFPVCWGLLTGTPEGIHLLEQLFALYHLDHQEMREKCKPFAEELVEVVFNPRRAKRMAKLYDLDMMEYLELI